MTINAPADAEYRLKAAGRTQAEDNRLAVLERLFDPLSRRRRSFVEPGWRCLEVGGGRGSMARFLAEQVGPTGEVVVTDIDTRYLDELALPNVRVVRHNILADPLEALGGPFDVVSSRLMLFLLAGGAERAVNRMAECVRPGGWLVDEDGDWGAVAPVDPNHPMTPAFDTVWRDGAWWTELGHNPWFGRTLTTLFERAGLVDLVHETTAEVFAGGSEWARWWADSIEVIGAQSPGMSTETVAAICGPFRDPSARVMSALLHSCRGRRPLD
jgi:SAM-dependent methyltransferase